MIIKKEGQIMKKINWDLLQYTVQDYVQIYLNQGCLFESDEVLRTVNVQGQTQSKEFKSPECQGVSNTHVDHMRRYAEFFTDFCLQEDCFLFVNPSSLACSIIAFARKHTKISVIYPSEMETLTGTTLTQIKGIYQKLEKRYYECFPQQLDKTNSDSVL
jgi:hypothetical protein